MSLSFKVCSMCKFSEFAHASVFCMNVCSACFCKHKQFISLFF